MRVWRKSNSLKLGTAFLAVFFTFTLLRVQQPSVASGSDSTLTPEQELGKRLFFDPNLSVPPGQSCSSCHSPQTGWADPRGAPVSFGAAPFRCTNRNAPTAAYAAFSPRFHWNAAPGPDLSFGIYAGGIYQGGLLWDGLAKNLRDQAMKPFLKINEMNNPDEMSVVQKVRRSDYAGLFRQVFGEPSLNDVNIAYGLIATALAAYESSPEVCAFTSKYDYYLEGKAQLADQEMRGLEIFKGKGTCADCHSMTNQVNGHPLFTNYAYINIGVPKNPDNPFYRQPPYINPDGIHFIDRGLGGRFGIWMYYGMFKVPTLRNAALTAPYMHNGVFGTLYQAVHFHNTRDILPWPPPEVPTNVFRAYPPVPGTFGRLGLTEQEELDLVAFLETLTDGYVPDQ